MVIMIVLTNPKAVYECIYRDYKKHIISKRLVYSVNNHFKLIMSVRGSPIDCKTY